MKNLYIFAILFVYLCTSCVKELNNVDIIIEDQYRHYYPVIQGQPINLSWKIGNLGKEPLVLTDIMPTCGCIEIDKGTNNIIPPGKYITLSFKWDSSKNLGYSSESIFLYGNINKPNGVVELVFDTNVVPVYNSSPDYEEYYVKNYNMEYIIKGVVNGRASERGYWINDGEYEGDYSKTYNKYPWLKEESVKK